jgi:LmbE family N-acetylglucosaminyl deacetylase
MKFKNPQADTFVPDGSDIDAALKRTTHLAVVAHADDIEIMAYHGIAACFGTQQNWFTGVVVSDGAGSPRSGIYERHTDEQMKRVRILEQRKAAYVGEYSCQLQLGYLTSLVKDPLNSDIPAELSAIFMACTAQTIYLHNLADKHDTHIGVVMHSIAALRRLPRERRPSKVYGCEVWRDLDWMPDAGKQALSVSARENIASSLVGVFDSQISGGKRYDLATPGRRLANATYSAAHSTDADKAITFAMDLTPLVNDPRLNPLKYVTGFIEQFREDVAQKVGRFCKDSQ